MPTDATSGPLFNTSSPSAQTCNDLWGAGCEQRWPGSGSPLYALTWSEGDMPAGVAICRLRASARHALTATSVLGGRKDQRERSHAASSAMDLYRSRNAYKWWETHL